MTSRAAAKPAAKPLKRLIVRNDEAYERAHRLARRMGASPEDVVVQALRAMDTPEPAADRLSADIIAENRAILREAVDSLWAGKTPPPYDAKAVDDWMYDENGLPH